MKKDRISLFPDERAAIHAKLGSILKAGDPAEILLVIILLLALRPVSRRKDPKKKGQPQSAALKLKLNTGSARQAMQVYTALKRRRRLLP
jgi:hypothetical protein